MSALDGKRGALERQPTKHVRTHTHKLKPLNHFTVVPHLLSPLRFQHLGHLKDGCQDGDKVSHIFAITMGDTVLALVRRPRRQAEENNKTAAA